MANSKFNENVCIFPKLHKSNVIILFVCLTVFKGLFGSLDSKITSHLSVELKKATKV